MSSRSTSHLPLSNKLIVILVLGTLTMQVETAIAVAMTDQTTDPRMAITVLSHRPTITITVHHGMALLTLETLGLATTDLNLQHQTANSFLAITRTGHHRLLHTVTNGHNSSVISHLIVDRHNSSGPSHQHHVGNRGRRPLRHVGLTGDLELLHLLVTVTTSLVSTSILTSRIHLSNPQVTTDRLATIPSHSADDQSLVVLSVELMAVILTFTIRVTRTTPHLFRVLPPRTHSWTTLCLHHRFHQ